MNARKNILILDCDATLLIDLQRMLEDAGFDTFVTWNCAEARKRLREHTFELLMICDHPPEVNPTDFLAELMPCSQLPPCLILKNAPAGLERLPAGLSVVCRRDYDQVLRAVRRQLNETANGVLQSGNGAGGFL